MYSANRLFEKSQLAVLDGLMVFLSLLLATWLRHGVGLFALGREYGSVPWVAYLFPSVLVAVVFVILFRFQGLYALRAGRLVEALRLGKGVTIGTMAVLAVTFFYRGYSYSRATVILFYPLCLALLIGARALYRAYLRAVLGRRQATRRALIVGFGRVGRHLAGEILADPTYYHLAGFLDDDPAKQDRSLDGVPVLGPTTDLARVVAEHDVDEVLLAIPSAPQARVMDLLGECLRLKVAWKVVPYLCDLMLERIYVDQVGEVPLVGLRGSRVVGFNWVLKRAFDITVASLVLALFSPVLLLATLAIKATSRGPVFFRQKRIGLRGRPFTFLKFRTMRAGNDPAIHQDYTAEWIYGRSGNGAPVRSVGAAAAADEAAGPAVHKIARDPRITAVGRLLRKTSLDELPQLWNVLRGDMSIVGPRPPIPYEVERYTEWHRRRLDVLPGITGLWQVSGRNALTFDEMVRLDIEYIETWSLEQDIRICLKTIPAMISGKAY